MNEPISLAKKVELLFEHAERRGQANTYRAVADATGENANNIRKIYLGENENPGLRTIMALAGYFRIGLGYFECTTRDDCEDVINGVEPRYLTEGIARRLRGISPDGLNAIWDLMDYIIRAEQSPPAGDGKRA